MALRRVALVSALLFGACILVGHTGARLPTHPVVVARPTSTTVAVTTTTTSTTAPPVVHLRASRAAPRPPQPQGDLTSLLARIRHCESRGRYDALNARSTASGAYQILDTTWRGWVKAYGDGRLDPNTGTPAYWPRAYLAPPDYQDLVAARALARQGPRPWNASKGCWG